MTTTRLLPSIHRVASAPITVAGIPTASDHRTTRQSMSRARQYGAAAASVEGSVAGSGDATAMIGGGVACNRALVEGLRERLA